MANADCKQILNLIPLYIDNELSDEEIDIVSQHLESCKKCKSEFEFMKSVMVTTKGMENIDLPKDFHKNLMEKAEKLARAKRANRILLLRRAGTSVAAAAVIALSVVTFNEFIEPKDIKKVDQYRASKLSDSPLSLKAPSENKEKSAISVDKSTENIEKSEPPQTVSDKAKTDSRDVFANEGAKTETEIPKEISIASVESTHVVATVTLKDDIRDEVLKILADYEKDETGYIVQDIESVSDSLNALGAQVQLKTVDNINKNYIIIKP